ncbi:Rha family transcriptional regulator, partial [Bacillus thuringiensis]
MGQLTDSSVHSSLVFEVNGKVVTDSLVIAKIFKKDHFDVLKEVRKQIVYVDEEFGGENFHESTYVNSKNRWIPKYDLTEEAFTLLVMGYTTREAVGMKIKFMKEFKRMKQYIQNQQNVPKDPMGVLKLTFAALEGHTQEIQEIKSEVKELRENTPLYAIECEEIIRAVKRLG